MKMIIQSRERCREKTGGTPGRRRDAGPEEGRRAGGGTQSRAGAALKNRIGFFRWLCYNTVRKAGMGRLLRLSPSGRPETLDII